MKFNDELLNSFRARAAGYDQRNEFFTEDFFSLQAAGYLAAVVPTSMGGSDLSLSELVQHQRKLASFAPATALGINMHLVWVQVARFLHDRSIDTLDWVLREASAGEVFAFGISEAGNDAVLLDSYSQAVTHPDGGYLVTGTKVFTTLSPVWTRLGVHARITDLSQSAAAAAIDPAADCLPNDAAPKKRPQQDKNTEKGVNSQLLFGFVRRDAGQLTQGTITHPGHWNPLGMRATQSYTSQLDAVPVHESDIAAIMPAGDGTDPLVLAIFSSFSVLTAAVYAGIADRAIELATAAAKQQRADGAATKLDDPELATRLTNAVLDHRASLDALTVLSGDIDAQQHRDDWFIALAAARNRVSDEARRTVDMAMRVVGSQAFQADHELARLYRDVLAGMFHPSSAQSLAASVRTSLSATE